MSSHLSSQSSDDDDIHPHRSPSSSRRVLAQVLARKERDSQQMHQLLKLTLAKLDEQSQRASDAERRATECLIRARTAMDARAQSDADAAAARAELALYKMQLEQAQREVSRAQEYLDGLEARRHDAEQEAARARSVARKLQEERSIEAAREQGKQQGYNDGLRQGILLGRREAENNQPRSRRRQEEDHDRRPRSRPRRPADVHFTQVIPESPPQQSPSERSPPDDHRIVTGLSPEQPIFSNAAFNRTPDEHVYDTPSRSPSLSPSPPQRSRSRSHSRPRLETPAPEPARSRPYTPHDDSTPSIIQPIPIPASVSPMGPFHLRSPSPVRHPSVRIPPDNWIPRAQDTAGDGRLSIFLPPPHELVESILPDGPYAIIATPEEGSPAIVPPPPILSPSPGPRNRRTPDYDYATPSPPELGPVRNPNASRSRDHLYAATPPPPDLGPPRARNNAAQPPLPPPPPPDLGPASEEPAFIPPQQITTNNSHASTHLSEFDLLAPVGQPPRNIGTPPDEEDELEYIDAQTEPIPRQPIAPDPAMERRHAHVATRPSRGPPRPRNIVFPAPLSQAHAQPTVPSQPPYMPPPDHQQHGIYMQQQQPPQPRAYVQDEEEDDDDDDAPVHVTATSNRPQRTHTQSSIGIHVQPPSPDDTPPSSGDKAQRRLDLLSPEHAERNLPMSFLDNFISRNKPRPKVPQIQEEQQQPLAPLPELAGLAPEFGGAQPPVLVTNAGKESRSRRSARSHKHSHSDAPRYGYAYEAAPVPDGIDYPASPFQQTGPPVPGPIPVPMSRSEMMLMRDTHPQLSPLSSINNVPPSSGFLGLGLKGRLPWRRNTATAAK